MKLSVTLAGGQLEVDCVAGKSCATLTCNGIRHEAGISQPEPGFLVVVRDGRIYRCQVDQLADGSMEVEVNGDRLPLRVRDLKHLRGSDGTGGSNTGSATLTAPMPGKVVRLLASAGDEVVAGQGVLVVEAMKMQNEIQAPRAGRVIEIRVREGQTVNSGEAIAVI